MKVGYVRVSTAEQNTARQEVLMKQLGVEKVYIDKISGKSADRPQLREMLSFVRNGDTVMVEAISRFARNTKDLLELIDVLQKKGVEFVSQKEKIDTSTPTGRFMLGRPGRNPSRPIWSSPIKDSRAPTAVAMVSAPLLLGSWTLEFSFLAASAS